MPLFNKQRITEVMQLPGKVERYALSALIIAVVSLILAIGVAIRAH